MPEHRVLVVSHDATRTGAPLFMLAWVKELKAKGHDVIVLLCEGGPLEDSFREVTQTYVLPQRLRRLARRGHSGPLNAWFRLRRFDVSAVWMNTIMVADLARPLCSLAPVIWHVHELRHWITTHVPATVIRDAIAAAEHLVVVSQEVGDVLVEQGAAPCDVSVVHGFARPCDSTPREHVTHEERLFRLGGAGTTDWRKGPDLFVQLALELRRRLVSADLVWMGGSTDEVEAARLEHDVVGTGLSNVTFLGQLDEPDDFYEQIDAFVLTSREDPFPLVMLEAAGRAIPLVAFEGSGGATDFIHASGGGLLAPYMDVPALADAVEKLMADHELAFKLGRAGRDSVRRDHTPERIFGQLCAVLDDVASVR